MTITETMMNRRTAIAGAAAMTTGLALGGPGSTGAAQGDPAIEAAVYLSELEVDEQIFLLYQRMHPDAVSEVPFYAVQYWYENVFLPRGPEVIEPTGVESIDWTWEVTGVTYPNTAEVSFTQSFADGETVEDVVRLVEDGGEWRWFFGRSRAFVDEQIALGGEGLFPEQPAAAPDWVETLSGYGDGAIDALPEEYPGDADATLDEREATGRAIVDRYANREGYTIARVTYDTLFEDETAVSRVETELGVAARSPAFSVEAWDLRDDSEVVYAVFRQDTGPVNQDFVTLLVANERLRSVWQISAPDLAEIEQIAVLLRV